MRALSLRLGDDGRRVRGPVWDWPACPPPGPGQLRTRTLLTGITNGTERNGLTRGNYAPPDSALPSAWGYQNVGAVEELGSGVSGFRVGEVVFCGGAHVETCVTDAGGLIIAIPRGVDPRHAALWGMASVAFHDVRRAAVDPTDRVLVVGAGPVGQFAAQVARIHGASVVVADPDGERRQLAAELGADEVVDTGAPEGLERLKRRKSDGGAFSVVVEASGADVLDWILGVDWSGGVVGHRARLVLVAGRGDVRYTFNAAQSSEVSVLHAGHFTRQDLEQVARLTQIGALRIGPVIRDVVRFEAAEALYDKLRDRPAELMGTVIEW